MNHWLVLWGDRTDVIRGATGEGPADAMKDAFGLVASDMCCVKLSLYEMRTRKHRTAKSKELVRKQLTRFEQEQKLYERSNGEFVVPALKEWLRTNA